MQFVNTLLLLMFTTVYGDAATCGTVKSLYYNGDCCGDGKTDDTPSTSVKEIVAKDVSLQVSHILANMIYTQIKESDPLPRALNPCTQGKEITLQSGKNATAKLVCKTVDTDAISVLGFKTDPYNKIDREAFQPLYNNQTATFTMYYPYYTPKKTEFGGYTMEIMLEDYGYNASTDILLAKSFSWRGLYPYQNYDDADKFMLEFMKYNAESVKKMFPMQMPTGGELTLAAFESQLSNLTTADDYLETLAPFFGIDMTKYTRSDLFVELPSVALWSMYPPPESMIAQMSSFIFLD